MATKEQNEWAMSAARNVARMFEQLAVETERAIERTPDEGRKFVARCAAGEAEDEDA